MVKRVFDEKSRVSCSMSTTHSRMFFPILKRSLLGAFEACSSVNAEVLLGVKGRIMSILLSNFGQILPMLSWVGNQVISQVEMLFTLELVRRVDLSDSVQSVVDIFWFVVNFEI